MRNDLPGQGCETYTDILHWMDILICLYLAFNNAIITISWSRHTTLDKMFVSLIIWPPFLRNAYRPPNASNQVFLFPFRPGVSAYKDSARFE
jgi:hypothetical protein